MLRVIICLEEPNVAAINRAQFTLNEFPQTPATKHALEIMVEAYDAFGNE